MKMTPTLLMWIMVLAMVVSHPSTVFSAEVGVNYGRNGDDLPSPIRVLQFLKDDLNYAIPMVRIFEPNVEFFQALLGTNMILSLGVRNDDIPNIASSQDAADKWLNDFVNPYVGGIKFRYITVGNEAIPGPVADSILPAMRYIYQSLSAAGLSNSIKVTTVVATNVLGTSYPPSNGAFAPDIANTMSDIANFLYETGAPLMVNVYPYFAFASDPAHISLDYALFQSQTPIVVDGNFQYFNLFDAIVDAFVAAMVRVVEKEDVRLAVSESGWPSAGNDPYTSIDNAQTYNNNLKEHIMKVGGTPRRPDLNLETYIFALFNENLKPNGIEQNFGNFYPNLTQVYPLWS